MTERSLIDGTQDRKPFVALRPWMKAPLPLDDSISDDLLSWVDPHRGVWALKEANAVSGIVVLSHGGDASSKTTKLQQLNRDDGTLHSIDLLSDPAIFKRSPPRLPWRGPAEKASSCG